MRLRARVTETTSYGQNGSTATGGSCAPTRSEGAGDPKAGQATLGLMAQQLGSLEKALRFGEGRRLKRLAEQAAYITSIEPDFERLSDEELAQKTVEFKQRFENGESLEDMLFEAYATVREAFKRTLGVRLFDVQVMGGIVLHEGDIAEMKTGEGKTFVAVQPLYLNALTGNGVHLVTVNDYLAKRDANWVGPVYEKLGMRAGWIENLMPFSDRTEAYACDVTYGTNSEFGFDYLRDNMAVSLEGVVQRGHAYAIVDEVDSILIDEARTPLIISGEPETAARIYYDFARVVRTMTAVPHDPLRKGEAPDADYEFDEKHKTIAPTQSAIEKVERALRIENLYDPRNSQLVNHLIQAVIRDIKERHEKGQPVLVGTIAVETSEYLSELLKRQGIPHSVLNAKEHAREAEIIKDAGEPHAVTIATNMAGRGVDIKLGEGVRELGGLYVLGTERHEARRIDNQLRGRSGRQGDPGESRFYLSGQDDLVRLFAGNRIY